MDCSCACRWRHPTSFQAAACAATRPVMEPFDGMGRKRTFKKKSTCGRERSPEVVETGNLIPTLDGQNTYSAHHSIMSSPRSTNQDIVYDGRGRGGSAHQDYYVSGALQGPQRRSLHVPAPYLRPRSAPPRRRDRSSSRGRSPMSGTRNVVKDTFTSSLPGLGVGVVGAVVGGLAARELSDAAARRRSRSPNHHQTSRLLTSLAGAAALGLGCM